MSHYKVIISHDEGLLCTVADALELMASGVRVEMRIGHMEVLSSEGDEKDNATYHLNKMGLHFLRKGVTI